MRFPLLPFFTDRICFVTPEHSVKMIARDRDAMWGISFLFVGVDTITRKTALFSTIYIRRVCVWHSVLLVVLERRRT